MPSVLDAVGKIGLLVGVGLYLSECHDRAVDKHSREWLLIATQTGKPGNGGQIEALQELVMDGVDISGINLQNTFLFSIDLSEIFLTHIDVGGANLTLAKFCNDFILTANFSGANLDRASFRYSNIQFSQFNDARLDDVDLRNATILSTSFAAAHLDRAVLSGARFRAADLKAATFVDADVSGADFDAESSKNLDLSGACAAPNNQPNLDRQVKGEPLPMCGSPPDEMLRFTRDCRELPGTLVSFLKRVRILPRWYHSRAF